MKLVKNANAKINLGLDVLRRREDGYHDVKMIMQMVDLYDTLTFENRKDEEIHIYTDHGKLPCDEHNLIYKAAMVLFAQTGKRIGADITLEKRIPIAAGMAGGSTDAAATLLALNEMMGQPLSKEKLQEIAVQVGADVPYCVLGGTALSEGIGEVLTALPAPPEAHLLIAKPDIDVSTAFVYQNLRLDKLQKHPDIDGMVKALQDGDLKGIADRMENVLETVTVPAYPIIGEIKEICRKEGALNALMSGSGPTVFGVYEDREKAQKAAEKIKEKNLSQEVFVTGFQKTEGL
ncbi:MAG: 4-(cytidine 5'-diphospho)-2-C-methyl-D-erythritol kinase [Lachnospiraceae bacterium]|nr:4-(cytidine 5'-diphospho)-2-C-methyl-D-erythritol kinase [Lachnospiraceae bacterium]